MSSKYILVLDPGDSMGYCIITITEDKAEIIKYGYYDVDTSSSYIGDNSIDLQKWVSKKIEKYNIKEIIRESYFFSSRFTKGVNKNLYCRGAIDIEARKHKLHYEEIIPSRWKKFICGKSTPTKEQKNKYKNDANKCMVLESLYYDYNIRFPNYSISQKNGRIIKFRYDTSDAVAIAIFFIKKLKKIKKIKCDIIPPKDHIWRETIKFFDYNTLPLIQLKQSKVIKTKCKSILQTGKRKGEECGAISKKDNYCMRHSPFKKKSIIIKIPKKKSIIIKTTNLTNLIEFNSNSGNS